MCFIKGRVRRIWNLNMACLITSYQSTPPLNNDCSLRSVISTTKSTINLISKKHSHLISSHNIGALSSRQWMIINETSTRRYCFDV